MSRPHVLLSVTSSIDGYIDDSSPERLLLSHAEDFDRVDQVRAESDAILIGASTIRADNPRLLVKSAARRAARVAQGKPEHPLKVTITATGNLDSRLRFWHFGGHKLVYTTDASAGKLKGELSGLAEIVALGPDINISTLLDDLGSRGVGRLMVEGGGVVHTAFLSAGLVDEIHLAIAPIVVGDSRAPRFLLPANYPGGSLHRMRLVESRQVGDVVLLRYRPQESSSS